MILNDRSYVSSMLSTTSPKEAASQPKKAGKVLIKEQRNISIVILTVVCVSLALVGGLVLGVRIENSRVAHCTSMQNKSDSTSATSVSSWMCPEGFTPVPAPPVVVNVVVEPANTSTSPSEKDSKAEVAQAADTTIITTPAPSAKQVEVRSPFSALKPAVIEIGVFAICQALGVRVFKTAGSLLARKLPHLLTRVRPLTRMVVSARRVMQKSAGGLYKATKLFYKKTAASKIVTRAKKNIKTLLKKKKKMQKSDKKTEGSHEEAH